MKRTGLKFLVIGAVAAGGTTAVLLKNSGTDVEIVCKYDNYVSFASDPDLEVSGVCSRFN